MICCIDCFKDTEIRAAIEMVGHIGDCPVCRNRNTWIYDSEQDSDKTNVGEMLDSILELYVPESELPTLYPEDEKMLIGDRLLKDWSIFSGSSFEVKRIVSEYVSESLDLDSRITMERVGIPQLFDETYLKDNSIMGKYSWDVFKKYLRNENRFHSKYINLEILEPVLKETETIISAGTKFYRARVSDKKGYSRKEMWAPPDDAFDYVTVATFKFNRNVRVLDLSLIVHSSPFYTENDKVAYLVNESTLRQIQNDMAKPISRLDSDLDYLPTQYISDFAKFLGYDGVKYFSTFDKTSYNVALFDSSACDCIYHRNFLIGNLEYKMTAV